MGQQLNRASEGQHQSSTVKMQLNYAPLKEPRGFIRIIQFFMAILAFATTADYSQQALIKITPLKSVQSTVDITYELAYPFDLEVPIHVPSDTGFAFVVPTPKIDKESTAEFYVTTGVLSFLFSAAAAVFYVLMTDVYENSTLFPFIDLVATGILTFFWFISWCTWVAQEGNIRNWYHDMPASICSSLNGQQTGIVFSCDNQGKVSFAKLTISLIFGFGNIILWAGSGWFVYKETHFHKKNDMRAEYAHDPNMGNNPAPYQQSP